MGRGIFSTIMYVAQGLLPALSSWVLIASKNILLWRTIISHVMSQRNMLWRRWSSTNDGM
jgi:hypothetical protein